MNLSPLGTSHITGFQADDLYLWKMEHSPIQTSKDLSISTPTCWAWELSNRVQIFYHQTDKHASARHIKQSCPTNINNTILLWWWLILYDGNCLILEEWWGQGHCWRMSPCPNINFSLFVCLLVLWLVQKLTFLNLPQIYSVWKHNAGGSCCAKWDKKVFCFLI